MLEVKADFFDGLGDRIARFRGNLFDRRFNWGRIRDIRDTLAESSLPLFGKIDFAGVRGFAPRNRELGGLSFVDYRYFRL